MGLKKENLRMFAYNTIKQEIVTLKLSPGAYLDRERLQEGLKVGATPIREALLQLEAEHLVTSVTKGGFYVKDMNLQSIKDLLENRLYLERYVGFLAIQRMTEKEIEELEKIALEMEALAESDKEYEVVMKDMEFHTLLVKISRNSQLEKIMSFIYNECLRVWFISHYEELNESVKMHFETVEVLKKKDWKLLDMDITNHNVVFRERVNNYFQKLVSTGNSVGDFKVDFGMHSLSPSGPLSPVAGQIVPAKGELLRGNYKKRKKRR